MALTSAPVLGLPNNTEPFILDTDLPNYAIGAELIQVQGGEQNGGGIWQLCAHTRADQLLYHYEGAPGCDMVN